MSVFWGHFFFISLFISCRVLQQNVMILLQLYFLIFEHFTMLGLFFIHFNFRSTTRFNPPFSSTTCIFRNDTKKNLLSWKNTNKKVHSSCFLVDIAHLADNFLEVYILMCASFWKFIIQWLQHYCLTTCHKKKLWGL